MAKNITIACLLAFMMCINTSISAHKGPKHKKLTPKDAIALAKVMAGNYSSAKQSKLDTTYFNIKLRMKPIWASNPNGSWLYVEQAIASAEDKPYRQRIYHVYLQDDSTIISKVYEVRNPKQYINAWKDPSKLLKLTPDSLIDRVGCGIALSRQKDGHYKGATPGKECLSSLRGAKYATSEVTIEKQQLVSWDRGWSAEDKQVWGAEKGGYVFIKEGKLSY